MPPTTRSRSSSAEPAAQGTLNLEHAAPEISSLKRVREGSLEPTQAEPATMTTKKNRVSTLYAAASTSDLGDVSAPTDNMDKLDEVEGGDNEERGASGQHVKEVRQKVAKMSYEEEQPASTAGADLGKRSGQVKDEDDRENKSEGLKRKASERNKNSCIFQDDTKKQKDVSSPSGEPAETSSEPENVATTPAKKQATFSSFASSASPFAALKTTSSDRDLEGPTPSKPSSTIALNHVSAVPTDEKVKQAEQLGDFSTESVLHSTKPPSHAEDAIRKEPTKEAESILPIKTQSTFATYSSSSPFPKSNSTPFGSRSTVSPFAAASTPSKDSAFGTYSTSSTTFGSMKPSSATFVQKEGKEGNEKKGFGDILQETKGDVGVQETKVEMQELDVTTGEEGEQTIFQARSKLYINENGWKERGVGLLKLNVDRSDGTGARLVMRADGVFRLLLNSKLYKGLNPTVEGKTVLMTLPNVGEKQLAIICLRLANAKVAEELADHIHEYIPLDSSKASNSRQSIAEV
nr:hypothetical protein L204_05692 [Cryptococcus depauperatus CBS 7855]